MIKLKDIVEGMSIPKITMYASYYDPNYNYERSGNPDDLPNEGEDYKHFIFNPNFKKGIKPIIGNGANGRTNGNPSILVSKYPFNMFSQNGDELPYICVEFVKFLNEIFLDDEFDTNEMGIPDENYDTISDLYDNKGEVSLDKLLQFGLNIERNDLSFYGCYVKDIKANEIKSIKEIK